MGSKRSELVSFLNETRDEFLVLARSLTSEQLDLPTENPGWSVRDTIAHLASSEAGLIATAKRIAGGEPSPRPGFDLDAYNQRQVEKRRGQATDELLSELAESRREMLATLAALTDEQLAMEGKFSSGLPTNVFGVFRRIGEHERLHSEQIREAIAREKRRFEEP